MPPAVAVCSEAFFAIARKGIAGTFPNAIPLYNIGGGVSSVAANFLLDGEMSFCPVDTTSGFSPGRGTACPCILPAFRSRPSTFRDLHRSRPRSVQSPPDGGRSRSPWCDPCSSHFPGLYLATNQCVLFCHSGRTMRGYRASVTSRTS